MVLWPLNLFKGHRYKFGDEVVVPSRTFVVTASAVVQGGTPIFADIDLHSQNITAETIQKVVTAKKGNNCGPCGRVAMCNGENYGSCREAGLYVIEDCAQAHAKYKESSLGPSGISMYFPSAKTKLFQLVAKVELLSRIDEICGACMEFKDHGSMGCNS